MFMEINTSNLEQQTVPGHAGNIAAKWSASAHGFKRT
jgi:hypothetical protein